MLNKMAAGWGNTKPPKKRKR